MERKFLVPVVKQSGGSPRLQSKTVTPTKLQFSVSADEGYDGLSGVTVEATPLQPKAVLPSTSSQTVEPDENYVGLSAVTVGGVTSSIDANITAENIKKDVTILGVTGSYEGSGGGGGGEDVIFYDYDGTVVQRYSKDDFLALTAMPENPSHTGLVAQGWNWSLSDAKTYVTDYGKLNVGQMYKTASGLTEFDIELTKATGLTITFKMEGTTNWGDGNSETTTSSSTHTYANYGKYTITCDGTTIPGHVFSSDTSYYCTKVRVGENVTSIGNNAFPYCMGLASVTIPNTVTSIGESAFYRSRLTSITIPSGVTSIGASIARQCFCLTSITIPSGVTSVGSDAFYNCYKLTAVVIPSSVTSIGTYAFYNCRGLTSVTIPNSVTSIGYQVFYSCSGLTSVIIGSGVTSIDYYAFQFCYSNILYDFSHAVSVPTLTNTNAFQDINGICKIVVPDALYNTWVSATNWTTYANYIYRASEVN